MPSNHLILCHPLLLLPSIFPSIRVFSSDSALCIRWPKCCSLRLTKIYSLPTPKAGASSQVRCQQGCTPSKGSRRQSFLASSSSWRLLQSSWPHPSTLCLHLHMASLLCVSLVRTFAFGFRATRIIQDELLIWRSIIWLYQHPFSKHNHSHMSPVKTWMCLLGTTHQPTPSSDAGKGLQHGRRGLCRISPCALLSAWTVFVPERTRRLHWLPVLLGRSRGSELACIWRGSARLLPGQGDGKRAEGRWGMRDSGGTPCGAFCGPSSGRWMSATCWGWQRKLRSSGRRCWTRLVQHASPSRVPPAQCCWGLETGGEDAGGCENIPTKTSPLSLSMGFLVSGGEAWEDAHSHSGASARGRPGGPAPGQPL